MRDVESRHIDYFRRNFKARVRHLALAGLDYSLGLFGSVRELLRGRINLCVQVKLLADAGGAGIVYNKYAAAIRLIRGAREFTDSEKLLRDEFQSEFSRRLHDRLSR